MKKVVICASAAFYQEAQEWKIQLENMGYSVIRTIQSIDENDIGQYKQTHTDHYSRMSECNIVFVLNLEKKNIPGYIGAGVFAEIAFAIGLNIILDKNIEILLVNPLPEESPYLDELTKWQKLGWLKQFQPNAMPELVK
ncbi:hypothetical protein KKE14_01360 [Patescibacteria group bacterium]|nr:hypothetical protein [Patescibacteria group bacterium]